MLIRRPEEGAGRGTVAATAMVAAGAGAGWETICATGLGVLPALGNVPALGIEPEPGNAPGLGNAIAVGGGAIAADC